MSVPARIGQSVLALIATMAALIAVSVFFVEDPFPRDAQVLVASNGVGMGVLLLAAATFGLNSGSRWAWAALWVLPAFLGWHIAALGTVVPDAVLLVVAVAALVVTRPRRIEPDSSSGGDGPAVSVPASR